MYRSSSSTRVSDEYSSHKSASALSNQNHVLIVDHLPTYNPQSEVAKKEKSGMRSAENAIHFIPLLLVLCAIILWFFSSPVDAVSKGDSLVASSSITAGGGGDFGNDASKSSLLSDLNQSHHFVSTDLSLDPANFTSTG